MVKLSYVFVTDYSLVHSITGPAIAHLLRKRSQESDLELIAARMFEVDRDLMRDLRISFKGEKRLGMEKRIHNRFDRYMIQEYEETDKRRRAMLLVFKGDNAVDEVRSLVGSPRTIGSVAGGTLREKYGHFKQDAKGRIIAFEPVVLIPFDEKIAERGIRLFSDYSQDHPGVLDNLIDWNHEIRVINQERGMLDNYLADLARHLERPVSREELIQNIQRAVFMVKPPVMSQHPHFVGEFLAYLAGAGRKIVGVNYVNMTVEQFNEFYGHLPKGPLKDKPEEYAKLCDHFTGHKPEDPLYLKTEDAEHACLPFVIEGPFIVPVVRKIIGPTNPDNWRPGQIRHDYARSIDQNAIHGTDDPKNFERERGILGFDQSPLPELVNAHYK